MVAGSAPACFRRISEIVPAEMTDEVQDTKLREGKTGTSDAANEHQQGSGLSLDTWGSRQKAAGLAVNSVLCQVDIVWLLSAAWPQRRW